MLPCRGLRPAQFVPSSSRQSIAPRISASRKFSSLPRTAGLAASPPRTNPLQSCKWRTSASGIPNVLPTVSSVRYGSWYAPWSWGKSSTPQGDATTSAIEQAPVAATQYTEPVVTSATPELAPAGIDRPPVPNSTVDSAASFHEPKTMDDLLGLEPEKDVVPQAELDPTALIDHAGQLKELGLDYGYGMTTMFEKVIEGVYLNTGYGWAGSIMVAGVAVRLFTFFFQALSSDRMAAMSLMKPVTQPIQEKMEAAVARGDKDKEQIYKMQLASVMKPHVGGFASMAGFMIIQGWVGFSAFRLLRAMGTLPVPGMTTDGLLWFTDLTVRDPYFILPATTTAIFYGLFKMGGETGVANDASSQGQFRTKLMTGMAFFLGIVTAFQPAALQVYFLTTGILGALTGYLLRQNGFRRFIRIRPLPSPESNEMYSKVVKGELKLKDIRGRDGKIRYQAPRAPTTTPMTPNKRNATTLSGVNVKAGTAIPLHLQPKTTDVDKEKPDRDEDWNEGPTGNWGDKLNWYWRNYRVWFVWRRMQKAMDRMIRQAGFGGKKMTEAQEKRKHRADMYEIERRRRFENRS